MSIVEMSVRKRTKREQEAFDMGRELGRREATRHGLWIDSMKCSVCGQVDWTEPNYCPCCGAKMDGGADDAD